MKTNYVYIVECSDHTYYTGWTTNLERRIKAHNEGNGAKYTKVRRPVKLIYFEEYVCKKQALKREYKCICEYAIKQLTRKQKELLINKNL